MPDPLSSNPPQTTASTVDDNQIQPAVQPTPQTPQNGQPSPANQAALSTAPKMDYSKPANKSLFDRVLGAMSGNPTVTDPQTGETRPVPMTRKTMSSHILAGAITSIIQGAIAGGQASAGAPAGPTGTNTPGNMAALGAGAKVGSAEFNKMKNGPQAALDEQQVRAFNTMKRNIDLNGAMLTLGNASRSAQDQADSQGQTLLDQADAYDPTLIPVDARGLTAQDALKRYPKLSANNFIAMGHQDMRNPDGSLMMDPRTGNTIPYREPLFAVIDPEKKIPMTDELKAEFGSVDPQLKQVPVGTPLALKYFLNANVQHVQQASAVDALKDSAKQISAITGQTPTTDFGKAIQADPVLRRNAGTIGQFFGHGNSPDEAVAAMLKNKVDPSVIQKTAALLGLGDVDKSGKSVAQRLADKRAQAAAADKALTVNEAETIVTNPNASKEDKDRASSFLNDIDKREVDKETRKNDAASDREQSKQDAKDVRTKVYAMDANGNLILSNYKDNPGGEVVKDSDVMKDRSAMRQLGDVQVNTTRYAQSLRKPLQPGDTDKMQEIMALNQQTGGTGVSFGQGGVSLNIPVISAKLSKQNLKQMTNDLAALSPNARERLTGYLRTAASVPAYQKAIAGTARSNKETLDLELANIPMPYYDAATAGERLGAWQENIDRASNGYPKNLAGMIHPSQLKSQMSTSDGGVVVILPNGQTTSPFKSQAAAEAFKREAGIQ